MKTVFGLLARISFAVLLFSVPVFSAGTDTIFFSIPKVNAFRGDTVRIPLNISTLLFSDSIYSGDISLSYDTTVVQIFRVEADSLLSHGSSLFYNPALKKIGFASGIRIVGGGVLVKLVARLRTTATSFSPINFMSVLLNEGGFNIKTTNGEINPLNRLPKFVNVLNDTSVIEKDSIVINFAAIDPDGDPIKYSLGSPIKDISGVFFDSLNGIFAWRPKLLQGGIGYLLHVTATDDRGGFSIANINLTVKKLNQNPQIAAFPDTIFRQENALIKDTVIAIDPDFDPLTFSLQNAPIGMSITSAGSTQNIFRAEISWTPGFDQAGIYPVTLTVSDNKGGVATKAITYRIADVNRFPIFTIPPRDTTIAENTLVTMSVKAFDADNDTIIYGLNGAPTGMTIDPLVGTISWLPDFIQIGTHTFDVGAGDKKGLPTKVTATFTVTRVNKAPQFVSVLPDTTIKANGLFAFQYSATDADISDTLKFGLVFGPQGVSVSMKGLLTWTPSSTQVGKNLIITGVSDGIGVILDTAFVTVQNVNKPPQFITTLPDTSVKVGDVLNFKYTAVDPDNDNFIFSLIKFPSGAIIQTNGIFTWAPTVPQMGKDTIIAAVSDGFFVVQDTAIITVTGSSSAKISQNNFDFGSVNFGSTKTLSATITNTGNTSLSFVTLPQFNQKPDANFIIDTTGISFIAPGVQRTFTVTYQPKSVGGHSTSYVFITNDQKKSFDTLTVNGSAIAKLAITKKLLVDTLHQSPLSFSDSTKGVSQLFKIFEQSGIQISLTGSDLRPSGNDILLLIAPQKNFTRQEIDSVKKFVTNGGLLVALGNSAKEGNNAAALNSLLKDTTWTTNLALDSTVVIDPSSFYSDTLAPLLTTFADAKHPYFANVDTLVFFASASVTVSGSAIPLITTTPKGKAIGAQSRTQPAVAGLSKIGKGKILLLGDADVWGVESVDHKTLPNISVKDNLAFAINVFSVTEDYEVKLPNKTFNERYQLVSIPFDLDNANVASVLKGLGEQNPLVWRLFGHYDPVALKYAEFPSDKFKSFKRGEAYWLITRGEFGLSLGNSTIVPVQSFYPIKIGPGYSMVGNPFPYKVSWKNSIHDSTQSLIWGFDGQTFKAESLALDPFAGYFVKNLTKDSVTIYINPEDITGLKKSGYSAAVYAEGEWRISIGAASGKSSDEENYAGVAKGAKDEFDSYDVAEPPSSPTDYVIVRFQNNSWKDHSGSYAMDIRSISSEGLFWDFDVVTANSQSRITLNLSQFGNLPNDFVIYVVDKTTERVILLDQTYQYEFTMSKNESRRNFRLIAGKKDYIEKNTQGIPLVAVNYSLMQNYPNPFNPSTQIRYTLGHSGQVSLDVYNVLGQHVRSLTNTIQLIGTYELEWDGKDNAGITVSTGVYFYKITVITNGEKTYTETKKLMLLK